jgi:hypothetical protein
MVSSGMLRRVKKPFFIVTAVKTSNLTKVNNFNKEIKSINVMHKTLHDFSNCTKLIHEITLCRYVF